MPRPTLKQGDVGKAVEAAKRAVAAYFKDSKPRLPASRVFGPFFTTKVKLFQWLNDIPQTGVVGPRTWEALDKWLGPEARALLAPDKPKLIEPKQGFSSLHKSLWAAYSYGRSKGLFDLGTYNKASRLPSGAPSDHSVWPAFAFDLGFDPDTGWDHAIARAVANYYVDHHVELNIEYVILGTKIWSRSRGWHSYTGGGHMNHIHVSGVR